MSTIADFEFNTSSLSEGVLLISQAIRPNFPVADVQRQLEKLTDEARAAIPENISQDQQVEMLIDLFFHQWKFGGAGGIYQLSDAIWLDNVLEKRQGTAISLGVVFLHIANKLSLPLMPVLFPTQLILRADWLDEEMWLINPLNGDTLNEHTLEVWIKGNFGTMSELEDEDLEESENLVIVRKILDILKAALIEEKQMERALCASEVLLAFDPNDPYEIRDRGLIYAQLECNHVAISDLSYFVEQCPEDPIAEMIKIQINSIEQMRFTLH